MAIKDELTKLFTELELYENDEKTTNLIKQVLRIFSKYPKGLDKIEFRYLYKDLENIPDSTKGDCPKCSAGLLSIDLDTSFEVKIYNSAFDFDIIICDKCDYTRLEYWVSVSDNIQIESN